MKRNILNFVFVALVFTAFASHAKQADNDLKKKY
jgi:hypothetical protein